VVGVLGVGPIDPDAPAVHADDLGFSRGDGCFEATRVVTGPAGEHRIDRLDEHFDRFDLSCAGLDLPPVDRAGWRQLIDQLLARWTVPGEAMLRLLLSRGRESELAAGAARVTGVATLTPMSPETLRQRAEGVAAITLCRGFGDGAFTDAPWLLGGVKTLSYAVNMAAAREAARRGADDVLFVSADGFVLEAPTGTAVWAVGRTLRTTPLGASGILGGTTQQRLFDRAGDAGWRVEEAAARVDDLHEADVLWVVSSVRGPIDVIELDGKQRVRRPDVDAEIRRLAGF